MKKLDCKQSTCIVFIILSLVVIIPILIYTGHTFPVADDFNVESDLLELVSQYHSYFVASLIWVGKYYVDIGGYYSSVFFSYVFSPWTRWGLSGARILDVSFYIFFFAAAFFMIHSFVKEVLRKNADLSCFLYFVFLLSLFNNFKNSEIYTWYVVVAEYVFISGIMMLGFGLLFRSIARNNRLYIVSAICAFIVSGGMINMAVSNCGLLFLFGVYAFVYWKRLKETIIVFGAALTGALINLLSPGNYIRHDTMGGGFNIVPALKHTVLYSTFLMEDKIFNTLFVLIGVVVFLVIYSTVDYSEIPLEKETDSDRLLHPAILAFIMIIGIMMINFPVHLGYNDPNLSPRAIFVQDLATYLLLFMWIYYFARWLKVRGVSIKITGELLTVFVIVLALISLTTIGAHGGLRHYTTGDMTVSILSGDLDEYIDYEVAILDEIKNSPDSDVEIIRSKEIMMDCVKPNWLKEDTGFFLNAWCAKYYGKNTVKMIYLDQEE